MLIKSIILILLLLIVLSLFSALIFFYKDKGGSQRTAKALTVRISLSIFLFILLMSGLYFGVIPSQK